MRENNVAVLAVLHDVKRPVAAGGDGVGQVEGERLAGRTEQAEVFSLV